MYGSTAIDIYMTLVCGVLISMLIEKKQGPTPSPTTTKQFRATHIQITMTQTNPPASIHTVRQRDKLTPELALAQTPVPVPSQPADVPVEVAATALCYSELTWVSQNPRFFAPDKEPVPGQDMSGTVVQDGPGSSSSYSSSFKPGDQVFCRIDAYRRCQTDSDYSVNITILSERVMRITAKTTR